jgi:L,D-transpeptidase ErfK/SrfK
MRRLMRTVKDVALVGALCFTASVVMWGRDGSHVMTGAVTAYTVQPGDSLISMGARFGVEASVLAEDNDMPTGRALRAGQVLLVDSRHIVPAGLEGGILINIPQRMLFVARGQGVERAFPVAVGRRDWPSPIGTFEVGAKEIDPTWDVPISIQREMAQAGRAVRKTVLPGPDNPLGDRWLGLKNIGVGIHGTNQPTSVFRVTTHGCIRLHPDDARVLFALVEVGSPVRIVYEPVLVAVDEGNHVWLEVHRDAYGRAGDLSRIARDLLQEAGVGDAVEAGALRRCVQERRGRPCQL